MNTNKEKNMFKSMKFETITICNKCPQGSKYCPNCGKMTDFKTVLSEESYKEILDQIAGAFTGNHQVSITEIVEAMYGWTDQTSEMREYLCPVTRNLKGYTNSLVNSWRLENTDKVRVLHETREVVISCDKLVELAGKAADMSGLRLFTTPQWAMIAEGIDNIREEFESLFSEKFERNPFKKHETGYGWGFFPFPSDWLEELEKIEIPPVEIPPVEIPPVEKGQMTVRELIKLLQSMNQDSCVQLSITVDCCCKKETSVKKDVPNVLDVRDFIPMSSIPDGWSLIPAGSFMMGSPEDERGRSSDENLHEVELSKSFLMKCTPVTHGEWLNLMGNNPSYKSFKHSGMNLPVNCVSWFDAIVYCNALSEQEGLDPCYKLSDVRGKPGEEDFEANVQWNQNANGYRLPTEAEWEYACRAGSRGAYHDCSSSPDAVAWYCENSDDRIHPVGQKKPNAWGLFDMHGNVWEWVWDRYADYPSLGVVGPIGPERGSRRVSRGGSWNNCAARVRAAFRYGSDPGHRNGGLGFRPCRSIILEIK